MVSATDVGVALPQTVKAAETDRDRGMHEPYSLLGLAYLQHRKLKEETAFYNHLQATWESDSILVGFLKYEHTKFTCFQLHFPDGPHSGSEIL